jgi:spermidine synthase
MRNRRDLLLLLCFFLSGLAALIYQTAWTRLFAFVFGTSELAVATVLAAYMGGLAAGAAVATRFVGRVRRPVLVYGLLELGIALSALAVPLAMRGATALYGALFRNAELGEAGGLASALFYLLVSFAILLVPTALMGATLPLLVRHAVRSDEEIGPRTSALYAINTLGAVVGTLLAGFFLLPSLGLRGTLWVAIGANALVFGVAALAARGALVAAPATAAPQAPAAHGVGRWVLPLMLISGAISFSYEVLWSRLLGHLLGGSLFGFATMLASFLTGIALGSALAARQTRTPERAARALALAWLGSAALSLAAFWLLDRMPAVSRFVSDRTGAPLLADAAVAALILLPGALCIGATFPLAVRVLARSEADAGPASARIYVWNTLGAIVGSIGSGFLLLPWLGYEGLVTLAVALGAGLALAAQARAGSAPLRVGLSAGAALLLGVLLLPPDKPWRLLRSSAISARSQGHVTYFGVGRSATVMLVEEGGGWRLRTNGLPESLVFPRGAHVWSEVLTQWLAGAASLARPDARNMLVIGFGGGVVLEGIPSLVESIDVVELEPEVLRANESIAALRREDPMSDPRIRIIVNDARGALQLADRRYDIIASQPSHPWTGGAAHLYTREFFELAREHLTPDGVLAQWMALHFADEPSLRALVASLVDVFPHVRVYQPSAGALLLLASPAPLELERGATRALELAPAEFAEMGVFGPESVAAALSLDDEGSRRFADGAARNTDDHNVLEIRSFRVGRDGTRSLRDADPFAEFDPLLGPTPELDRALLVRRLVMRGFPERARRVADATADPAVRATAKGIVAASTGRPRAASRELLRALELDPTSVAARATLLRLNRNAIARGERDAAALVVAPGAVEQTVEQGWRADERGDEAALEALEARLAAVDPNHLLYEDALRLRVAWRLASGDVARAREAVPLVDTLISASSTARDEILRARLLAAAGDAEGAVITLSQAGIGTRSRTPADRSVARKARRLVRSLPDDPSADAVADAIRRHFPDGVEAPAPAADPTEA